MRLIETLAVCALALSLSACVIGRQYIGAPLAAIPEDVITPGVTTMSEVLASLGAPDRIQRRREGEVFIYRYLRKNSSGLRIVEPVVTGLTVLRYDKRQEASDRVVVMFDKEHVVIGMGHTDGRDQLDPF